MTWQEYEAGLEGRLADLHSRVHQGAYRALPSRRVYIEKVDGRKRPLGIGFQWGTDAGRFRKSLEERLGKFRLELHPEKTRRIEFGRYAEQNRTQRGEGTPETFNFLGFTHIRGKNGNGSYAVRRMTIRKRMRKKLQEIKQQLKMRMHDPEPQTGAWLRSVVQGYFNYYAVPGNLDSLGLFRGPISKHRPYRDLIRTNCRDRILN